MPKTALVVSGGGSKGAFAVGAIQHLVEDVGLSFDVVCGTSTGALIAPFVVTGEIEELVRLYTTMRTEDIVVRRRASDILGSSSIFDVKPLADKIKDAVTQDRAARVLSSQKQMFIATVCLQSGEVTYFQSGPKGKAPAGCELQPIDTPARLVRAMLASADMPALMPPIEMVNDSNPPRQYVDGGVRERAPLEVALLNGATEIYAVVLAPKQHAMQATRYSKVPEILLRTIGILTEDVLLHDLRVVESIAKGRRYLAGVRKRVGDRFGLTDAELGPLFAGDGAGDAALAGPEINLHVIRPLTELPIDTLTFNPGIMTTLVVQGRDRAVAALKDPNEWLA